jgi:hypothetical protein
VPAAGRCGQAGQIGLVPGEVDQPPPPELGQPRRDALHLELEQLVMGAEDRRPLGDRLQILGQNLDELVVDVAGHQEAPDADLLPNLQGQVVRLDRSRDLRLVLHDELPVHRQQVLHQGLQRRRAVLGRQQRRVPGQESARPVQSELRDQDVLPGGQLQQPGERHQQMVVAVRREQRVQADQGEVPDVAGVAGPKPVSGGRRPLRQVGVVERRVQGPADR